MRWVLSFQLFLLCSGLAPAFGAPGILKVSVAEDSLTLTVSPDLLPCEAIELSSDGNALPTGTNTPLPLLKRQTTIPRFDHERDRIYSGFVVLKGKQRIGEIHFAEGLESISRNLDSYPKAKSKKGLQVQMVDDALALGVKHAALNFDFGGMVALKPASNDLPWKMDGRTFYFRRSSIEHADARIKTFSDRGIVVTLILLNYKNSDVEQNKVLLHPDYDNACPQDLSAFNTKTPEGLAWFKACVEFLANRYSQVGYPNGRVANYIVGNEVNSHWWWSNMGHVDLNQFVTDYARTVRVCNMAVRKYSATARTFVSLEHHWNIRYPAGDATQSFPARAFIDLLNEKAKACGDFDWNLAYHPYPENLFNPKTWEDKSATFSPNTPRINFKNLELVTEYFRRLPLLYLGKPRHIILSEQGFHSDGTPEGEQLQAAAYCYAYYKTDHLDGIDSFILHRHVDHPAEGGLNLGLWRRNGNSAEPLSKKPSYEVFRKADTAEWKEAFQFALPLIGIESWAELSRPTRSKK
jgi:hypothetical protein